MNETISVVLPVYNAEQYLEQCLGSICWQTYRNLEIICVNDGSTDGSLAIMREYEASDKRVRVIDKQNEGYGASCNRGIAEANGTWISIVEPDDYIEQGMYASMIEFANEFVRKGTPLDIVKTPYWRIVNPDTKKQARLNCSYKGRVKPTEQPFGVAEATHLLTHHPSIWSALYRKSFLDARGIKFKEIPGAGWADNPFLVETLCQTGCIGYLDAPFYCYREETEGKSREMALNSTLVPYERWNDMMDVLERLEINDERILRAQIIRGFKYLGNTLEYVSIDNADLREAVTNMFARMDADLVFAEKEISPELKKLFATLRGIPCPELNDTPYKLTLVREGLYTAKNAGVGYTLRKTVSVLKPSNQPAQLEAANVAETIDAADTASTTE